MICNEKIGFGCFLPGKSKEEAVQIMRKAIECGYRYFDTASFYETERSLGQAIKEGMVPRKELFIASKAWIDERGYRETKEAFYRTLDRLGTDYLDAYLIHWPKESVNDQEYNEVNDAALKAMEDLKQEGVLHHVGTSNFLSHHLENVVEKGHIIELNQLELHPGHEQSQAVEDCKKHNILVQAWSPLGRGALMEHVLLKELGEKYGKTPAQICLIYLLQKGIMPLVKASSKERMVQNLEVFDVTLDREDMQRIACMPPTGWSGEHPDFCIPRFKSNFQQ